MDSDPDQRGAGQPGGRRPRSLWRSFPIFADLGDEALADLDARTTRRRYAADQGIFRKGDAGSFLLALTSGRVKLSILSQGGRELLIRQAEAGDIVGEIACLDGAERSTDATAAAATEALFLSREDYLAVADRHPSLREAAIVHLCGLLRATNDRLESVSLYQLQARIARFLLFTLNQLHGADHGARATLPMTLNQTDLGLMVGASRPKVNKVLRDLRDLGILDQDGSVWHCDVAALQRLTED